MVELFDPDYFAKLFSHDSYWRKMRKLLLILFGFFLVLSTRSAFANPCPNGNFNPNNNVCMCPNGGYVGPGERCAESSPEYIRIRNWSYYSNARPRSVNEVVADAKSQGYGFTSSGFIYEEPQNFFSGNKALRENRANDYGRQGLIYAKFPAKVYRWQAEYIAAVKQGNNTSVSNDAPVKKSDGWVWVKAGSDSGKDIYFDKKTLTYNAKTRVVNTLIKAAPSPCYEGGVDQNCYNVLNYQFQCDKQRGAATRLRTYETGTNQLLHDNPYALKYNDIRKGLLLEHEMIATCAS